MEQEKWLDWAIELQALAQNGLTYTQNPFELERYGRIREIAAEMLAAKGEISLETVRDLFCGETGYQTPKLETRAAVFREGKILLVQENNGKWALPGGWVDVNLSVGENAVKEVREEAGLEVKAERLIAVLDWKKHNRPLCPWGICKVFVQCSLIGGEFKPNIETVASGYFDEAHLPPLATGKNSPEQIQMCFKACRSRDWVSLFD